MNQTEIREHEIPVVALAVALGHRIKRVDSSNRFEIVFVFDADAADDLASYWTGRQVEARAYSNAVRDVRTMLMKAKRQDDSDFAVRAIEVMQVANAKAKRGEEN